jgi:predicted Zn-ribbon and HTH transcriptional regulator
MDDQTTRQRMLDALRERPDTPSGLAEEFGVSRGTVLTHVRHLSQTLEGTDETLLVKPPECRECGFDDFDDPVNVPSRCPECKSEGIEEPAFTVEEV